MSWTSKQRLMETVVHQTDGHTLSVLKCKGATVLCDRRKDVWLLLRSASCCLLEVAETESDTAACTDRLLQGLPAQAAVRLAPSFDTASWTEDGAGSKARMLCSPCDRFMSTKTRCRGCPVTGAVQLQLMCIPLTAVFMLRAERLTSCAALERICGIFKSSAILMYGWRASALLVTSFTPCPITVQTSDSAGNSK